MDSNPAVGLLGFWMMMQLAATIALLLGGLYALYCLSRAASGLDRLASAMEEWVAQQNRVAVPPTPLLPRSGGYLSTPPVPPAVSPAQPFTPPTPPVSSEVSSTHEPTA